MLVDAGVDTANDALEFSASNNEHLQEAVQLAITIGIIILAHKSFSKDLPEVLKSVIMRDLVSADKSS